MAAATASAAAEEKSEAQGDATADVSSTNTLLITNISSEHITHTSGAIHRYLSPPNSSNCRSAQQITLPFHSTHFTEDGDMHRKVCN